MSPDIHRHKRESPNCNPYMTMLPIKNETLHNKYLEQLEFSYVARLCTNQHHTLENCFCKIYDKTG